MLFHQRKVRQSGWGLGKVIGEGKVGEAVEQCRREGGVKQSGQAKEARRWGEATLDIGRRT